MRPCQMGTALMLAGGALAGSAARQAAAPASQEPVWLSDYNTARAAAQQNGKPIFLVFR